jgi:SAM-dependent methyltransferase
VADTETTPELPASAYDLVIATEILEHVRDPLRVLANLCAALKPGGLFLCSLGESFEREVCGDHLREAVAKGQSREYQELFRQCLEPAPIADAFPWLFRRRPASALSDRD